MKIKLITALILTPLATEAFSNAALVGDIIARDLAMPGASWVGHVGVVSSNGEGQKPWFVLEAMGDAPHIQQNPISDFKTRAKYWGSKGGFMQPDNWYLSWLIANTFVRQYYACPSYSYTWQWEAGSLKPNTTIPVSCGTFRCDTLVNYAYSIPIGYSLPTYNTKTTNPLAIWNYFPSLKDALIPSDSVENLETPKLTNDDISLINVDNLLSLKADVFYQLLQNSENVTREQIINLWSLITSSNVDEEVRLLFYNFISFYNPDYLILDIIKQARKESGKIRNMLLVMLQRIYQTKLGNNDEDGLGEIAEYFKQLQKEKLSKDDSGIVYRGLATLIKKPINTKKVDMTNMDKIHVDIFSLNNDRTNELKYLTDIIDNLNKPDDSIVITATYEYLTELLINSDLKIFSEEGKKLFKSHLAKKIMIDDTQTMFYTSAYIEFKAALNAKNKEEIPGLVQTYMRSFDESMRKVIPYGFSSFTQEALFNE